MIEVFEACTPQDRDLVNKVMGELADLKAKELFGLWEDDQCIGGLSVSTNPKGDLTFLVKATSSVGLVKALQKIFAQLFKTYKYLHAKINLYNKKSIKIMKQVGGRKLYIENGQEVFIFTKELWKYQKKWPI